MPTNIYDVTFPPDTQLANLLGSDLRNLALNVQQRMALISGLSTAMWNPALDAQPTNWTGLLFFATDTGQIYQWTGTAWIVISSFGGTSFKDTGVHVHTGDTTEDTIYTAPISAGALGSNGILSGKVSFFSTAQGNPGFTVRVRFGTSIALSFLGVTNTLSNYELDFQIANQNTPTSQVAFGTFFTQSGASALVPPGGLAVNTAVAQNVTITIQSTNNTDSQTFNTCYILQH